MEKIIDSDNKEAMEKLGYVFNKAMEHLYECDNEKYEKLELKLYEAVYGKKLNEEMSEKWVKSMEPIGKHWTKEETTEAMKSMGYNLDTLSFFVVANMMYNDYYNLVKDDETMALKLAKDWLNDEDAKECKLYEYWKHVIKRN
jgi:hypothetical protein